MKYFFVIALVPEDERDEIRFSENSSHCIRLATEEEIMKEGTATFETEMQIAGVIDMSRMN